MSSHVLSFVRNQTIDTAMKLLVLPAVLLVMVWMVVG
jgi:hypothetical protein